MMLQRFYVLLSACMLIALVAAGAQIPTSTDLSYDVSSIKLNTQATQIGGGGPMPSGGYRATNTTVRTLIINAYQLRGYQLLGAPDWLASDRFDVETRGAAATPEQNKTMMRALLADRFKLVVHTETRETQIYALVLLRPDDKLGPKLTPSSLNCSGSGPTPLRPPTGPAVTGCGTTSQSNGEGTVMRGGSLTLSNIAGTLASFALGRAVIDRTGLTGVFDFELTFAPVNVAASDDVLNERPTIFTALQEQLGLKLESQRGSVEFLIIDSVERPEPN